MKNLFIIAQRYYRQYPSYVENYIINVQKYYNDDVDILLVDNNSKHVCDIQNIITKYKNVELIINTSDSKFELGAYRHGIKYMGDKIFDYEYIIFTQDTFILKNKYDFNNLINDNVKACTIVKHDEYPFQYGTDIVAKKVLDEIDMYNRLNEITICFCCTFILNKSVIKKFLELTNHTKLLLRTDSEGAERYLGRILFELNDYKKYDIDGYYLKLKYNIYKSNMKEYDQSVTGYYFQKQMQSKKEYTPDP